jgi:protein-S-isoprenylcysteine O-methyltransferase Ste14
MNGLAKLIGRVTGWDKNPGSVFYFAVPLAVIAFGLKVWQAILLHNTVMVVMCCVAPVILFVALWPGIKMMRQINRSRAREERE